MIFNLVISTIYRLLRNSSIMAATGLLKQETRISVNFYASFLLNLLDMKINFVYTGHRDLEEPAFAGYLRKIRRRRRLT